MESQWCSRQLTLPRPHQDECQRAPGSFRRRQLHHSHSHTQKPCQNLRIIHPLRSTGKSSTFTEHSRVQALSHFSPGTDVSRQLLGWKVDENLQHGSLPAAALPYTLHRRRSVDLPADERSMEFLFFFLGRGGKQSSGWNLASFLFT